MSGIARKLAAEALGTGLLVAAVVGSGIMAGRLTHDVALQLLCNTIPTGAMLFVLIALFADISGAQFNPAVTLALWTQREIKAAVALSFIAAQCLGGVGGTFLAHAMFALPIVASGVTERSAQPLLLSEGVATFGLLLTIMGMRARGGIYVAAAVALYILAAYWFTASTAFANPAVTLARAFTPSFSGIRPVDVPAFALVQLIGGLAGAFSGKWLFARS